MDVDYLLEKGKLIKINSKYGLLLRSQKEITYNYKTYIVYRIVALKDFGDVEKGELGGYIDKASSIDEKGDCWLYPTCYCLHYSFLSGNTKVKKFSYIFYSSLYNSSASSCKLSYSFCNCCVINQSSVCNCYLGYVKLFLSKLSHNNLFLDITLYEAEINKGNYEIFKNNFSSHRLFMYAYETKKWHVGCFTGSHEELIEKAYKDSSNKGDYYKEYVNLVKRLENMRGKM